MSYQKTADEALRKLEESAPGVADPILTAIDLTNFDSQTPALLTAAISPIVFCEDVTLLGAHGGAGKSALALSLCAHVATGKDWGPFEIEQGRAVYLSMEDPPGTVLRRLQRTAQHHKLDPATVTKYLTILDGTRSPPLAAEFRLPNQPPSLHETATMEALRQAAIGARLVVVDNASDAFDANENERRMVRKFVRQMLANMARDTGCAVLLLAHIDKAAARHGSGGNSYSGSTAWHNSARGRLALIRNDDSIVLHQEKNQHGKLCEPLALEWTDHGVLIPQDPKSTSAAAIKRMNERADRIAADDREVLEAIANANKAGTFVPTAKGGPRPTYAVLKECGDLPESMTKGDGKTRLYESIERLRRRGKINAEMITRPNRKLCEGWTIPKFDPTSADDYQRARDGE